MSRYFSHSSETGFEVHTTREQAKAAAEEMLAEYQADASDGWDEDGVLSIHWGEVSERAVETERRDYRESDGGGDYEEWVSFGLRTPDSIELSGALTVLQRITNKTGIHQAGEISEDDIRALSYLVGLLKDAAE